MTQEDDGMALKSGEELERGRDLVQNEDQAQANMLLAAAKAQTAAALAQRRSAEALTDAARSQEKAATEHARTAAAAIRAAAAQEAAALSHEKTALAQISLIEEQKKASKASEDAAKAQADAARWTTRLTWATACMAFFALLSVGVAVWNNMQAADNNRSTRNLLALQHRPCLTIETRRVLGSDSLRFDGVMRNIGPGLTSGFLATVGPASRTTEPVGEIPTNWWSIAECPIGPGDSAIVRGACAWPEALSRLDTIVYLHVRCAFRGDDRIDYYLDQPLELHVEWSPHGTTPRAERIEVKIDHAHQGHVNTKRNGTRMVHFDQ